MFPLQIKVHACMTFILSAPDFIFQEPVTDLEHLVIDNGKKVKPSVGAVTLYQVCCRVSPSVNAVLKEVWSGTPHPDHAERRTTMTQQKTQLNKEPKRR